MRGLLILTLVIFITGCNTPQPVFERTITVTEDKIIRDTTIITEPDTAAIKALFECDSLNQVVMTELEVEKGRTLVPQVKFIDRTLEVIMPVDSQAVYLAWEESHTKETEKVTVTRIVKEKYKPPWYIKVLSWIGVVALVYLVVTLKSKFT